jgi:Circularly permutated YpsA SLOG family
MALMIGQGAKGKFPSFLVLNAMQNIPKIVSGGQTGADRAALDWALSHKLPCGGWCPKGGRRKMARSMQNILSRNLRQLPIFSGPNGMSAIAMRPFYFHSHPN